MYEDFNHGVIKNWRYYISDIVAMLLSLGIAIWIQNRYKNGAFLQHYLFLLVCMPINIMVVALMTNNYLAITSRNFFQEFRKTLQLILWVLPLAVMALYVAQMSSTFSRTIVIYWFVLSMLFVNLSRSMIKTILMKRMIWQNQKQLFVVTSDRDLTKNLEQIKKNISSQYDIAAIGLIQEVRDRNGKLKDITGSKNIISYAKLHVVDEVLITNVTYHENLYSLVEAFMSMGVPVHYDLGSLFANLNHFRANRINNINVLTTYNNTANEGKLLLKRSIDILGSIIGLIITGFLMIIIGPIIYLSSPGPIIFRQKRVGMNGRLFVMYKFRSMVHDAETLKKDLMSQNEMDGHMFKMEHDPRVTPIGAIIRKTSIDELPQFFNVLKGDMSLVGTRPPTLDEYDHYAVHHKSRLAMRPGITGMWQTSGGNKITDFEKIVKLDCYYINHWSIQLDLKILLKTFKVVLRRREPVLEELLEKVEE